MTPTTRKNRFQDQIQRFAQVEEQIADAMAGLKSIVGLAGGLPFKVRKKHAAQLESLIAQAQELLADIDEVLPALQNVKGRFEQHIDEASKVRKRLLTPGRRG